MARDKKTTPTSPKGRSHVGYNPYAPTLPAIFPNVKADSTEFAEKGAVAARRSEYFSEYLEIANRLGVPVAQVLPFDPTNKSKTPLDLPIDPRDAAYLIAQNGEKILQVTEGMNLGFGGYTDAQVREFIRDYGEKHNKSGHFTPEVAALRHAPLLKAALLGVAPTDMHLGNKFADRIGDLNTVPLEIRDLVRGHLSEVNEGRRHKLSEETSLRIFQVESGFKAAGYGADVPHLGGASSVRGVGQFIPSTARQYGLRVDGKTDERAYYETAVPASMRYQSDIAQTLGSASPADIYNGYQQGEGKAAAAKRNWNMPAIDFYGRDEFLNNGGREGMTVGDFYTMWGSRVSGRVTPFTDRELPRTRPIYGVDFATDGAQSAINLRDNTTFYGSGGSEIPLARDHVFSAISGEEVQGYRERFAEYSTLSEEQRTERGLSHLKRLGYLDFNSKATHFAEADAHKALNAFRKSMGIPAHAKAADDALSLTEAVALGCYVARVDKYGARQEVQESDFEGFAINLNDFKDNPAALKAAEPQIIALKYGLMEAGVLAPEMVGRGKHKTPKAPDGTVDGKLIAALDTFQGLHGLKVGHGQVDAVTARMLLEGLGEGLATRGVTTVAGMEMDPAVLETLELSQTQRESIKPILPKAESLEELADGQHRFEVSRTALYGKGQQHESKLVQQMLIETGHLKRGQDDGHWGRGTDRGLQKFAAEKGLTWNGKGDAHDVLAALRDTYIAGVGGVIPSPTPDAKQGTASAPAPASAATSGATAGAPSGATASPATSAQTGSASRGDHTAEATGTTSQFWDGSARYGGGKNEQVMRMQELLRADGQAVKVDGYWQKGTNAHLAQAAKRHGVTWKAGEDPAAVIEAVQKSVVEKLRQPHDAEVPAGKNSPVTSFTELARRGDIKMDPRVVSPSVAFLQAQLRFLGHEVTPAVPDGRYGAATEAGLRAAARDAGVKHQRGMVSMDELEAIQEAVTEKMERLGLSPTEVFSELLAQRPAEPVSPPVMEEPLVQHRSSSRPPRLSPD